MNIEVVGYSTSINPSINQADLLAKLKSKIAANGISAVMTKKVTEAKPAEEVSAYDFDVFTSVPESIQTQNDIINGIDMEEAIPQFGVPTYPTTEIETLDVKIPEQVVNETPENVPVDFDPLENTLSLSLNDFAQEENYDKHLR